MTFRLVRYSYSINKGWLENPAWLLPTTFVAQDFCCQVDIVEQTSMLQLQIC